MWATEENRMEEFSQRSLTQFFVQQVKKDQAVCPIHLFFFFFSFCPFRCVICKDQTRGKVVQWNKVIVMLVLRHCFNIQPWRLPLVLWRCREKGLTTKNTFTIYREQPHLMLRSSSMMEKQATLPFIPKWPKIKWGKSNLWFFSPIFLCCCKSCKV